MYEFEASLVSELGPMKKEEFEPMYVTEGIAGGKDPLSFANPKTIISLIHKGDVHPYRAIEVFSDNKHILLAACQKDPSALEKIDDKNNLKEYLKEHLTIKKLAPKF